MRNGFTDKIVTTGGGGGKAAQLPPKENTLLKCNRRGAEDAEADAEADAEKRPGLASACSLRPPRLRGCAHARAVLALSGVKADALSVFR